jgi:phosphoribulokinase
MGIDRNGKMGGRSLNLNAITPLKHTFTVVTFNRAPLFNQSEAVARLRIASHDEMLVVLLQLMRL